MSSKTLKSLPDDPYFDVDLIDVDDLIRSATQLLDEVFTNRPVRATTTDGQENDMEKVKKFLSSIREKEAVLDEDDVVFVEAREGKALPVDAKTIAVVDISSPENEKDAPTKQRSNIRRGRQPKPSKAASPPKSKIVQPKKEPIAIDGDDCHTPCRPVRRCRARI